MVEWGVTSDVADGGGESASASSAVVGMGPPARVGDGKTTLSYRAQAQGGRMLLYPVHSPSKAPFPPPEQMVSDPAVPSLSGTEAVPRPLIHPRKPRPSIAALSSVPARHGQEH